MDDDSAKPKEEEPPQAEVEVPKEEVEAPKEVQPPQEEAEAPKEEVEAPKPKRRRKSGWDVPGPAPAVTAVPLPIPVPVFAPLPPPVMAPGVAAVLTPALASIAAAEAAETRRIAYERAQQMLVIAGLNKNVGAAVSAKPIAPAKSSSENRLYIGSLHYTVSEGDIRTIFGSIGPLRSLDMSFDPATQRSKGYCFIDFENAADAQAAMGMNGVEIAGRPVSFMPLFFNVIVILMCNI
jgi:hypothetical protein